MEVSNENRELENAIREIKEAKNLEKAKQVAKEHREKRKKVQTEVEQLQDEVYYGDDANIDKELKEGSFVRMRSGGSTGQIVALNKNKATIQMGFINMEVPLGELLPAGEPIEYRTKSVNTEGVIKSSNFESKLDIRGYTKSDAEAYVTEFMDKALVNNAAQLKIVHGKGSGVLKKVVLGIIRDYKDVREYWHPEDEMGGDGVTFVEF